MDFSSPRWRKANGPAWSAQAWGALFLTLVVSAVGCAGKADLPRVAGETAEEDTGGAVEGGGEGGGEGVSDDTGEQVDWPAGAVVLDDVVVVDARGAREGAAVVIVGDEIWGVTDAGQGWPDDATVTNLGGLTVIPGLVDSHVHIFHSGASWWVGDTLADNLAAQLAWGVVAVADLGSPVEVFALRDAIAAGRVRGPRIFATGPFLTAEGSHPCESVVDDTLCRFVEGDGPEEVAALAEADGIKVALADADFTDWPTPRLDLGDLGEIVGASAGPVLAHVDEEDDALDALAAGVAVLAHPVFAADLDETPDGPVISTFGAFSGTGALLDGSLLDEDLSATPAAVRESWEWLADHPGAFADGWAAGSAEWDAHARANVALGVTEGREIVAGSDAGYWWVPHGVGLHRELDGLVAAGMTPLEALAAATSVPAALFGWDDLGFVDAGYRADLVVVEGRPDRDIAAARAIVAVYLGGEPWERGPLVVEGADADAGAFCLDEGDCADGVCDLVAHTCTAGCDETYDRVGACDEETWCAPLDGLDSTADGACRAGDGCDLYAQDCAPASYGENCAPVDVDTNVCWPAGPRRAGQSCSWSDADLYCEQGLYCSWVTYKCYTLCDPDVASACASCTLQTIEGVPWFGLCL